MTRAFSIFCYPRLAIPFLASIISLFALNVPTLADDSGTKSLLDVDKSRQLLESDPDAWLLTVQTVESSSKAVASASSTPPSANATVQSGTTSTEVATPAASGPTLAETEKYIVDHTPKFIELSAKVTSGENGVNERHFAAQKITFNQNGSFDFVDKNSWIDQITESQMNAAGYDLTKVTVPLDDIDASSLNLGSATYTVTGDNNIQNGIVYMISMKFSTAVPVQRFSDQMQAEMRKNNLNDFNDYKVVQVDGGDEKDDSVTHLEIVINDKDTAERVLKAFKHALDLSGGGHKDPFAP